MSRWPAGRLGVGPGSPPSPGIPSPTGLLAPLAPVDGSTLSPRPGPEAPIRPPPRTISTRQSSLTISHLMRQRALLSSGPPIMVPRSERRRPRETPRSADHTGTRGAEAVCPPAGPAMQPPIHAARSTPTGTLPRPGAGACAQHGPPLGGAICPSPQPTADTSPAVPSAAPLTGDLATPATLAAGRPTGAPPLPGTPTSHPPVDLCACTSPELQYPAVPLHSDDLWRRAAGPSGPDSSAPLTELPLPAGECDITEEVAALPGILRSLRSAAIRYTGVGCINPAGVSSQTTLSQRHRLEDQRRRFPVASSRGPGAGVGGGGATTLVYISVERINDTGYTLSGAVMNLSVRHISGIFSVVAAPTEPDSALEDAACFWLLSTVERILLSHELRLLPRYFSGRGITSTTGGLGFPWVLFLWNGLVAQHFADICARAERFLRRRRRRLAAQIPEPGGPRALGSSAAPGSGARTTPMPAGPPAWLTGWLNLRKEANMVLGRHPGQPSPDKGARCGGTPACGIAQHPGEMGDIARAIYRFSLDFLPLLRVAAVPAPGAGCVGAPGGCPAGCWRFACPEARAGNALRLVACLLSTDTWRIPHPKDYPFRGGILAPAGCGTSGGPAGAAGGPGQARKRPAPGPLSGSGPGGGTILESFYRAARMDPGPRVVPRTAGPAIRPAAESVMAPGQRAPLRVVAANHHPTSGPGDSKKAPAAAAAAAAVAAAAAQQATLKSFFGGPRPCPEAAPE
ncbi:hypothetical protein H696_01143 [Fonticula alba]|uniref:Uncharacterized protein n=1 Tax=Fonticula alba TaxID=691883 RepID=A0A058ZCQ6_FONAL|nr:hypothetical protein H696_01143 [Fonticula alba]KCV71721.1 hypothetical protein H696_01143 [Fonticula alba]|eukprot:XP_009493299.1 hypothetical protein H696_01143 [Fonticula alba]